MGQEVSMFRRIAIIAPLAAFLAFAPAVWSAIGVKGGFSLSTQRQGGATQTGSQMGFLAGVFLEKDVNRFFSVQPEVYLIQKGGKKEVGDFFVFAVTTKLVCLDAVLLSKIYPVSLNSVRPFFAFGPVLSYIISGNYVYATTSETIEDYRKLEAGFLFGGGADVAIGKARATFDARYNLGWTDVHKVPTRIWNHGLIISAGFLF